MSADIRTEHFRAYFHDDGVWVTWESGSDGFFLDEALARQLQSIIDTWKRQRIVTPDDSVQPREETP